MPLSMRGHPWRSAVVAFARGYVAVSLFGGSALLVWPSAPAGQIDAAGFGAGATVIRSCDIETTPMAFGVYDPLVLHASQPLDREGSVTISCTKGTAATIGLNAGLHASGSARHLSNAGALLQYELFKDANRTERWGEGGPDSLQAGNAPDDAPRTFVVFGRIRAGQDVPVGTYTDAVVVTVEF